MYADYEYYVETYGGSIITAESSEKALQDASDTIDILTFNRIINGSLAPFSAFQVGIIKTVTCRLADWQTQNADLLGSPYESYTINGVSVKLGTSQAVSMVDGVLIPTQIYSELCKTGLCYRGFNYGIS